jgi:DNA-binding transcriptional ArsR family regulator
MDSTTALDAAIRGLADPIRRATLLRLAQGPATAGQLAALFSVSRPAVSRHLRVLRESELVTATTLGRHVWYEARHAPLVRVERWVGRLAEQVHGAPALTRLYRSRRSRSQ